MVRPPVPDAMKGRWTPGEDFMLASYVHEHGASNWNFVPRNTGLERSGISCRLRWMNHLNPDIKRGKFTHHEEQIIIHYYARFGPHGWVNIAAQLPGRTAYGVKNYWHNHLKKKLDIVNGHVDEPIENPIENPVVAPVYQAPPFPAPSFAREREDFDYPFIARAPSFGPYLPTAPTPSFAREHEGSAYQPSIFTPLGHD